MFGTQYEVVLATLFHTALFLQTFSGLSAGQYNETVNYVPVWSLDREIVNGDCPIKESPIQDLDGATTIILYSPLERQDIRRSYSSNGWSDEDIETFLSNGFKLDKPTLLFSHGTLQNGTQPWLMKIRNLYDHLFPNGTEPQFNLMIYDWEKYAFFNKNVSYSYAPPVGRILGEFIEKLARAQSYDLDLLHMIGFSLSTHIHGNAARLVAKNYAPVGQLTALDPSGPCFMSGSEFDKKYSLKATDAKVVVAKYHNMGGLGAKRFIGDIDILVNGGSNQPQNKINVWTGATNAYDLLKMVFTNHLEATQYASANFDRECDAIAYTCANYNTYLRGGCADCGRDGSKCYLFNDIKSVISAEAGYRVRPFDKYKSSARMFIKTNYKEPYCLQQYQLVVVLKPGAPRSIKQLLSSGGVLMVVGDGIIAKLTGPANGSKFTALISVEKKLQNLSTTSLVVARSDQITQDLFNSLHHVELNYMSKISAQGRAEGSYRLYPVANKNSLALWA